MKLTNTDSDSILAEKIRFFSQIVHQFCEEKYFRQASDFPLSSNQYYILLVLESSGPLTPGTLAELLDISAAAVVKNVDKLVKYNLVSRNPNHNDRRSLEIELLPDGLAIVKIISGLNSRIHGKYCSIFPLRKRKSWEISCVNIFTIVWNRRPKFR